MEDMRSLKDFVSGRYRQFAAPLLILLFTYAALVKLLAFATFEAQLLVQPFPPKIAYVLSYLIPAAELSAAVLLVFKRTRIAGLWLSLVLMIQFTGYAALALLRFWGRVPCPCGGILGHLAWGPHLAFNIIFLLITIVGIYLEAKERRFGDT
ncbi:MAG: MauE/DoxX family redox-associated membrane protein [Sphingobacteriales bacterium]